MSTTNPPLSTSIPQRYLVVRNLRAESQNKKNKNKTKRPRPTFPLHKGKSFDQLEANAEDDRNTKYSDAEPKDTKATSTSRTAKPSGKSGNDGSQKEIPYVLGPVPVTGAPHVPSVSGSTLTVLPSTPVVQAVAPATPGPGPISALLTSSFLASVTASSNVPHTSVAVTQPDGSKHSHIRTIVMVLVGLGCAFLSVGFFVVLKACRRPKRRNLPTPSLPILQDAYQERNSPDESPIFGGKERLSNNLEQRWTWTPYTQAEGAFSEKCGAPAWAPPDTQNSHADFSDPTPRPQSKTLEVLATFPSPPQTKLRPLSRGSHEEHSKRTVSRLSMMSYASPLLGYPVADPQNIGLALDTTVPVAANEGLVQEKEKVKAKRTSHRHSAKVLEKGNKRNTYTSLYGGVDVTSPITNKCMPPAMILDAPAPTLARGRERIKAPYPSTSLRTSASASSFASNVNPFEDVQHIPVPPLPVGKSEARRVRNTKAITAVLGLSSPPSPEMTIYPDDSLSVVGDARRHPMPSRKDTVAHVRIETPPLEASASLGNLMLNGFETPLQSQSQSFEKMESSSGLAMYGDEDFKFSAARTNDKPPRVPSPPPMPSLEQMALQHANPEEYASYRCPTASIYGYYTEEERKSRFGDFRVSTFH